MIKNFKEILIESVVQCDRIILRQFRSSDEHDVLEFAKQAMSMEYLDFPGFDTIEDAKESIYGYYRDTASFAIELKESGKVIGCIEPRVKSDRDVVTTGYILNKDYWGKGYMTEALVALIKLSFDLLQANKFEVEHYGSNPASGKVMEKAGLHKEGVLKQSRICRGKYQDVVWYGLTKEEFYQ